MKADMVAQLEVPPYRIDIMTSISGVSFEAAWAGRAMGAVSGVEVPILGKDAFRANKRATGRPKDLVDLESLGQT